MRLKQGEQTETAMKWQNGLYAGSMAANTLMGYFNYDLQSQGLENYADQMGEYYETVRNNSDNIADVAVGQQSVQKLAITTQERMHAKQVDNEQELMKISAGRDVNITRIQEKAKTIRSEKYAMIESFSARTKRYGGTPFWNE